MKKHTLSPAARTPATLDEQSLIAIAGGYDEDDWCGTRVPGRIPLPRPVLQIDEIVVPGPMVR